MNDFEIKFDDTSLKKFNAEFKKYPDKIIKAGRDIINMAIYAGERSVVEAVRSGPTRAVDTGNLMSLIGYGHTLAGNGLEGFINSNAPYSLYVHEGTKYMRARPYMDVGLKNAEGTIMSKARQILERAI